MGGDGRRESEAGQGCFPLGGGARGVGTGHGEIPPFRPGAGSAASAGMTDLWGGNDEEGGRERRRGEVVGVGERRRLGSSILIGQRVRGVQQ